MEMQKDVRKDEVAFRTNASLLCAETKIDKKTKVYQINFQAHEEFAEKLGEAIFNFYTRHYNI